MTGKPDPLLQYAVALDAGNFDVLSQVLHQAETDEGLMDAISVLHGRFDSNESFTQQLLSTRGEWEGKAQ
jgi:hypothetical protein